MKILKGGSYSWIKSNGSFQKYKNNQFNFCTNLFQIIQSNSESIRSWFRRILSTTHTHLYSDRPHSMTDHFQCLRPASWKWFFSLCKISKILSREPKNWNHVMIYFAAEHNAVHRGQYWLIPWYLLVETGL